jgi:hypothetical protein
LDLLQNRLATTKNASKCCQHRTTPGWLGFWVRLHTSSYWYTGPTLGPELEVGIWGLRIERCRHIPPLILTHHPNLHKLTSNAEQYHACVASWLVRIESLSPQLGSPNRPKNPSPQEYRVRKPRLPFRESNCYEFVARKC